MIALTAREPRVRGDEFRRRVEIMQKNIFKSLATTALVAGLAIVASPAAAATIDFTDASVWGASTGQNSFTTTVGGVGVTAQAQPAGLGATLSQSAAGMGVNYQDSYSWQRAQIDNGELLQLDFDQAVNVSSFSVDLFSTSVTVSNWRLNVYQDKGNVYYTDVDGNSQLATGIASGWDFSTFGATNFGLDLPALTGLDFSSYGTFSDYSLRSVTFSALGDAATVPELDPSGATAAFCLLAGMMVVIADRRRSAAV